MAAAILAQQPTGADQDAFPLEHKDLFIAGCYEASDAGWATVPAVAAEPPARPLPAPSYHALRELAAIWGLSPAALMLEAEALGLGWRTDVVLTSSEAQQLADKGKA